MRLEDIGRQNAESEMSEDFSPYHAGEQLVQLRAQVRERAEQLGRRMIRDFMPDEHRVFFERLRYAFVASLDDEGWPIATSLVGPRGFLRSPEPQRLELELGARGLAPELEHLTTGDALGVLGIEFDTRRRNRVNGRVVERDGSRVTIHVDQSFGNCPQYIQARTFETGVATDFGTPTWQRLATWTEDAVAVVQGADTCVVATASANVGSRQRMQGCDCSHRGGRPGFLRLEHDDNGSTLTLPDFPGNRSFNTLGNLAVNPKIGILILDFATGRAVHVSGRGEIIWGLEHASQFKGAERLVRVAVTDVRLGQQVLPGTWSAPSWSRELERTGTWGPGGA